MLGARCALGGTVLTLRDQTFDAELRRTRNDLAHMVMKCANPQCFRAFRHQYVGRIFRLRLWPADGLHVDPIRYFWLCASCSSAFTLIFHERRGVSLAPLHEAGKRETKSNLIFDITAAHSRKRDAARICNEHESRMGTALSDAEEEVHHARKRIPTRKARSRR